MEPEWAVFTRLYQLILAKFDSVKGFSESVLYNRTTVARKLCGESMFTTSDIKTWCTALEISKNEIPYYFFEDFEKEGTS